MTQQHWVQCSNVLLEQTSGRRKLKIRCNILVLLMTIRKLSSKKLGRTWHHRTNQTWKICSGYQTRRTHWSKWWWQYTRYLISEWLRIYTTCYPKWWSNQTMAMYQLLTVLQDPGPEQTFSRVLEQKQRLSTFRNHVK